MRSSSAVPMLFRWPFNTSASVLLHQVFFGLPTLCFSCGFQSRACLETFEGDFLSVWKIHSHSFSDLHFNGALTGLVPEVGVGNDIRPSDVEDVSKHLLIKVCSLWVFNLVVLHVSEPYSRTDLTLVLKILIFSVVEGEGWRIPNGVEGVECMSGQVDPALDVFVCSSIFVDDTAQVDKLLHPVQVFVVECEGVLFLVVYAHHLCILGVDIEAVFSASSARQESFSCASWCLCGRRLMSSAKSRSSSCLVKVHCMPVSLSDVACSIIQSTTRRKMVGDSKKP